MKNRYRLFCLVGALHLAIGAVPLASALAQCPDPIVDCRADCREEVKHCNLVKKALRGWLKVSCDLDYQEELFDCVDIRLDDDGACGVLCGAEQKACINTSKAFFKGCKADTRDIRKICKEDSRFELSDFAQVCKDDFAECKLACP